MSVKKKKEIHISRLLFCIYIVVMSYFLFLSDDRSMLSTYKYNLEPFKEIKRFITYRHQIGIVSFVINIIGNVVAFMPFGFLLPSMRSEKTGFFKTFAYSLLFTFLIETTQLVTMLGRFDIDDIIMNTLGGILGYFVYVVFSFVKSHKRK